MKWLPVFRSPSYEEAVIVVGFLRASGIPAELRYEAWERVVGLQMTGVEVLVPEDRVEEAREALAEGGRDLT